MSEARVNRRVVCLASLIGVCFLVVGLASCAAERTRAPLTATAAASAAPEAVSTPAPTLWPTPTSSPKPTQTPVKAPAGEPALTEHTVQAGETLLGLAKRYGVPMAAIQLHNGLGDSTGLQIGQELSIPPQAAWRGASLFWSVHVVQEGETLIGIARTYDLKAETLEAVNKLADADVIEVGQELVLALEAPTVVRAVTPTAGPALAESREAARLATPAPIPTPDASPVAATPSAAPAVPPCPNTAAWPRETVRLINEIRGQHGLRPLVYDERLAQAAQAHANDCAQRGWCSHSGSDGADVEMRILRAGYDGNGWAECWAQSQSPAQAVDMWMDEEPPNDAHRRTLLTTWLSEIGVGVGKADWGYYFIADFGRP